jgi:hypothetical protein
MVGEQSILSPKKLDKKIKIIYKIRKKSFDANIQFISTSFVTPRPTSKILSALVHGPHGFVLDSHVWSQNASY